MNKKMFLILPIVSLLIGCGSTANDGESTLNIEEINKIQEELMQESQKLEASALPESVRTVQSSSDEGYAE